MPKKRFTPLLRELAHCVQAFELLSGRHIRSLGLTPAQFNVITVLGETNSMNCGDLGSRALITKGTLTGVLDRLEQKGLVIREVSQDDRRSVIVGLTTEGHILFNQLSGLHLDYLKPAFSTLDDAFIETMTAQLAHLRTTLQQHTDRDQVNTTSSR